MYAITYYNVRGFRQFAKGLTVVVWYVTLSAMFGADPWCCPKFDKPFYVLVVHGAWSLSSLSRKSVRFRSWITRAFSFTSFYRCNVLAFTQISGRSSPGGFIGETELQMIASNRQGWSLSFISVFEVFSA